MIIQLNRTTQKKKKKFQNVQMEGRKGRNESQHSPVFYEHSVIYIFSHHQNFTLKFFQVYCFPWCFAFILMMVLPSWNSNSLIGSWQLMFILIETFSSSFCSETPTFRLKGHFKCSQHLGNRIMNSINSCLLKGGFSFSSSKAYVEQTIWFLSEFLLKGAYCTSLMLSYQRIGKS